MNQPKAITSSGGVDLRKRLYTATRQKHDHVEQLFDFKSGLDNERLEVFYATMLAARVAFGAHLEVVIKPLGMADHNARSIHHLRHDLSDSSPLSAVLSSMSHDHAAQVGIYYVFAGSSMGAQVILNMARAVRIEAPFHYLRYLSETAHAQQKALKFLLSQVGLDPHTLCHAANTTFDYIGNTAHAQLRKRNSRLTQA